MNFCAKVPYPECPMYSVEKCKPEEMISEEQATSTKSETKRADELEYVTEIIDFLEKIKDLHPEYNALVDSGADAHHASLALFSKNPKWYWTCDLQYMWTLSTFVDDLEIHQNVFKYANAMHHLIKEIDPVACEGFVDLEAADMSEQDLRAYAKDMCAVIERICPYVHRLSIDVQFENLALDKQDVDAVVRSRYGELGNEEEWASRTVEIGLLQ